MQNDATLNGTGRVIGTVTAQAGSFVAPGHSPGKLIIDGNDTQQPGSTLALEINGTTPGTTQDQIEVTGSNRVVTLTGSTLSVTTESKLPNGADITNINNVSSTSTVVGTFTDLPEGGTIVVGTRGADITYQGGTGNDVVLHVNTDDFGDAPTAAQSGFANSYPVTTAQDGARHLVTGPRLGANVVTERDGLPNATATGDDTNNAIDDEDGVLSLSTLIRSVNVATIASVTVDLQSPDASSNKLDAWLDFNFDGDWDDIGEQILVSANLGTTAGPKVLSFEIPASVPNGWAWRGVRLTD